MRRAAWLLAALSLLADARAEDPPVAPPVEPPPPPTDTPPPLPAPRLIGPRTGPDRKKALQRYGGNDATEKAVAAGLDWLARHANERGGWDADGFPTRCAAGGAKCEGIGKGQHGEAVACPFDAAVTGLAVLAFLGDGHLPTAPGAAATGSPSGPYDDLLAKSFQFMEGGDAWAVPIATEALAEAEAMERKGRFREDVRRRVEHLLTLRQEDGGWGYAAPWRPGSDVPYSAFVVSALVAARDAGVELPADLGKRVDAWLTTLEEHKGRLAYLLDGRKYGYTPTTSNAHCAVAIRELLGSGTDGARHRTHRALVSGEKPEWKISFRDVDVPGRGKVAVQVGNLSMYQWWYGTVGLFQSGGEAWSGWYGAAKGALVGHQRKDGCARGSWDPLGTYERQTGGRVLATALGVLMLEQPYRHQRLRP